MGNSYKIGNTILLHARLNGKVFYYAVKYVQYIHDVIPIKDLNDDKGFPTTPFSLATNRKPPIKHFRTFHIPAIFKRYEISTEGKIIKNKCTQQGVRGIFAGLPDDSTGWLFYVLEAQKTYISLDDIFDEDFT